MESDLEELHHRITPPKPGQFATLAQFRQSFVDSKHPISPKNRDALLRLLGGVFVRKGSGQRSAIRKFVVAHTVEAENALRAIWLRSS